MNLGENIYRLRTEKNLSQGDLADALEVSRQSVSKWENNSAVPELDKLVKMAVLFGVSLDELVTGHKAKPSAASATQPLTVRAILGVMLLSIGALAVLLLAIFAPEGLFLASIFFLVGLILLVRRSPQGIWCMIILYLPFLLFSCHSPDLGLLLTPIGIALGYAGAYFWDKNMEDDPEGGAHHESR